MGNNLNIVVLDGFTLNPGDLDWNQLNKLGNCTIYERTSVDEILPRAINADILLTNKVILNANTIQQLPGLKYIGVLATGYNIVDIQAAAERHIPVSNVPAYGTMSVAQSVFAHIMNLTMHTAQHAQAVSFGKWIGHKDFCFWDYPLVELAGLSMGIIGFGKIGRAVGKIADAFGMKVQINNRTKPEPMPDYAVQVSLETLFRTSDVISLHCPLTPETNGIINKTHLELMKKNAFIINTGRGQLVNEADLAKALDTGTIAGAGLDVLSQEPPTAENPLLTARNCYITPHIAWATQAARERLYNTVINNIQSFINNEPQNIVNNIIK